MDNPDTCKHCGAEYSLMGTTYGDLVCNVCRKSQWSEKDVRENMRQCENDDTWYDGDDCPKCLESEERAKKMFADPSGSGAPYTYRMYQAWRIKRGGY